METSVCKIVKFSKNYNFLLFNYDLFNNPPLSLPISIKRFLKNHCPCTITTYAFTLYCKVYSVLYSVQYKEGMKIDTIRMRNEKKWKISVKKNISFMKRKELFL